MNFKCNISLLPCRQETLFSRQMSEMLSYPFPSRIFQKFATSSPATTVISEPLQWERAGHAVVSDPDPSHDQGGQHQLQPHPDR